MGSLGNDQTNIGPGEGDREREPEEDGVVDEVVEAVTHPGLTVRKIGLWVLTALVPVEAGIGGFASHAAERMAGQEAEIGVLVVTLLATLATAAAAFVVRRNLVSAQAEVLAEAQAQAQVPTPIQAPAPGELQ